MTKKSKMGRPLQGKPRNIKFQIRMTEDEKEKLEYCSKTLGKTKTDIVNIGIDNIYNEIKTK